MAARLGYVLYWTACIIALLLVVWGINIVRTNERLPVSEAVVFLPAGLVWVVGRALRYLFAGN